MARLRVLVCGGGCAGPALAFWLSRAGHQVIVVERFPGIRTGGAQIDLREQGIEVARRMGLLETIRSKTVDEQGMAFGDEKGNVIGTMMANTSGQGAQVAVSEWEIMRGDFVRMMYDETKEDVEYVFGKHVVRHEQKERSVVVHFSDGSHDEFDILVGADGQGSRIRKAILPEGAPEPYRHLGGLYISYFFVSHEETDTKISQAFVTAGGRMVWRRTHSPTESQVICILRDDDPELASMPRASIETQKKIWHEKFKDVGGVMDSYLEGLAQTEDFYCQEIVQVQTDTWHKGRVVLLGDAAFCPSPFAGFGLSSSLIGAYVLAGELNKHSDEPEVALANYETILQPVMKRIQDGVSRVAIGLALPKSSWGVGLLRFLARLMFFFRIDKLAAMFAGEERAGWTVPDYPELTNGRERLG